MSLREFIIEWKTWGWGVAYYNWCVMYAHRHDGWFWCGPVGTHKPEVD